jgi:hypothetical protein
MAVYLISYDLNRQKDYARLIQAIQAYKAYARVLYSQWLVQSDRTAAQVATDLLQHVDRDDGILVAEMTQPGISWRSLLISDDAMNKWYSASRRC